MNLHTNVSTDAEWGKALWNYLRDLLADAGCCFEIDPEDLMHLAAQHGRAKKVIYNPAIHGEIDTEPGSEIWWWGDDSIAERPASPETDAPRPPVERPLLSWVCLHPSWTVIHTTQHWTGSNSLPPPPDSLVTIHEQCSACGLGRVRVQPQPQP
jgi:hypothetical protein